MACVISPVLLRQTPFRYTETLMQRRCNVWQPRMTDEHGLNWHDDTVCCFDLPFCLQNGPVINLERSLKADELIRTATQLRSLPLFVWPISPFMSWDPQLSATLVSTVPFFFRTLLILIILPNWFLQVPLRPAVRFWAGNAIMGNGMTFCVGNLLMNQHPFGWELSLTVVGAWVYFCAEFKVHSVCIDFFPPLNVMNMFLKERVICSSMGKYDCDIFRWCDVRLSCWLCLQFKAWLILTERMP